MDWAGLNLVIGAISNTIVKLFYVYTLGARRLFRQLAIALMIVCASGIITVAFYYDY